MAWVLILAAGIAEVIFAAFLGSSQGMTKALPAAGVVAFGGLAVVLLSQALRVIPLSTGYAVFTAFGSLGTAAIGIGFRGEPASPARVAALGLVIVGVVALRLTTEVEA